MDLAHLGIKIDYADIDKAVNKLKELEKVSSTVERQTKDISFTTKSNTELNKLNAELKALNKQAQILGETSSVSAREVDRLAAKLKYLEKQASLKGLSQGNRELQNIIRQTGQSIDSLTGKIKTSDNIVKRWWKRFGEVGVGFTLIYQTVNAITGALHSLNQVILEGIKQSGELAATQARLGMWLRFTTKGSIGIAQALEYAKQQTEALSDAALTSISTIDELSAALDELGQSQVIISPQAMKQFADLVDFTKMIAETTGSTTKQIRQEIQSLLQGQLRAGNILIRTAKNLGILTEQDIDNLKKMQSRYEIITKLSAEISKYMEQTKKYILSADVNTAFEKWEKALERIVSKSVQLTSFREGTANIFGETLYKHFDRLTEKINTLAGNEYSSGLLFLNNLLDKFLTLGEGAVEITLRLANAFGELANPLFDVWNSLWGIVDKLSEYVKKFPALSETNQATEISQAIGLAAYKAFETLHPILAKAIFGDLIEQANTQKDKLNDILNQMYAKLVEIRIKIQKEKIIPPDELKKLQEDSQKIKEAIAEPIDKILKNKERLDKEVKLGFLTQEQENLYLAKQIKSYYNLDSSIKEIAKDLPKNTAEWDKHFKTLKKNEEVVKEYDAISQKVKESIATPIEKLIEEKTKLDKLVEAGKISRDEELEYLTKEAKAYYKLDSSIEEIVKKLPKNIKEWDNYFKTLKKNEEIAKEIEKTSQKVKESLVTPIEKLIGEKKKLDEVVKAGKITKGEELEYLAKEAESYLGLKSPIEDVMKILSKSPDTWKANLKALIENEQTTKKFKKHLEELEKYAQQLEETADPLEKFITEFKKLKETQDLVGLTNQAFAEGLLQISKNIIDVTDKENKLREAFKVHAEELKTLPIEEVIEKIKKYYSELEDKQKTWKDGAIDALNEYAESASDVAKNMETVFTNTFNNLEDALVEFVTTGKASFSDLVNSILADLTRLTVRQTITAPLATALSTGLQSGFGSLFSSATTTTSSTAFSNLSLTGGSTTSPYSNLSLGNYQFASGDVFLNSPDLSKYENSIVSKPTLFTFASGMGLMGEAGPEAVIPLTRTSSGDLGVKAEVAPVEINIIDQRSASSPPVEIKTQNIDGKKQIRILIKNELESMIVRGELDGVFRQSYGLNRRAY